MLELKANPNKLATGAIIEASLDKGRGICFYCIGTSWFLE